MQQIQRQNLNLCKVNTELKRNVIHDANTAAINVKMVHLIVTIQESPNIVSADKGYDDILIEKKRVLVLI